MLHLVLKTLHIIGFVAWFGGLFYLVRIFVYLAEAGDHPAPIGEAFKKQYELMAWRAYKIICNPAMMFTWIMGIAMLVYTPSFLSQGWLHVKLLLLVLLTIYHLACKANLKKISAGGEPLSSFQYRLLNELPTLFLIAIVSLAVMKSLVNFLYLFLGLIALGGIFFWIVKAYKKARERK